MQEVKKKFKVRRILLFFLLFPFSFKLSCAAVDVPKLNNAEEQVRYAYKLKDGEKYEQAVLAFEKVLEYFPEDTEWCVKAKLQIGDTLSLTDNIENYYKAIDAYSKILKEYPQRKKDCASALNQIARVYFALLNNDEMAIETLRKVIRDYYIDQPQSCARTHNFIGMIYKRASEFQKAAEEFQKTIHSFPSCKNEVVDALIHIGEIYKSRYNIEVDYEEAIPPLSRVANDLSVPEEKRTHAFRQIGAGFKNKKKNNKKISPFFLISPFP